MVIPVAGLIMGIALRPLVVAATWAILWLDCCVWKLAGGMNGGEEELSEKPGGTVWGCCVGDDWGELLARDERSDALEMELISLSVRRLGQNSISSSRSKERTASNFMRKFARELDSPSSFILRTPRNCLCEFWETDSRGARRLRP